jgi:hypothetical protein
MKLVLLPPASLYVKLVKATGAGGFGNSQFPFTKFPISTFGIGESI